MKITRDNTGTIWSVTRQEIREKLPLVKPGFISYLNIYSRQKFITDQAGPALTALTQEAAQLRKMLGDKFLALALGGSLIRGLGSIETSDVDYYIYTGEISRSQADEVMDASWHRLRQNPGFVPCDGHPVISLVNNRWLSPENAVAVFTNYLVWEKQVGVSRRLALSYISRQLGDPEAAKHNTSRLIEEIYHSLMHNDPQYVARKYVQNRARTAIGEEWSESMVFDQVCLNDLARVAEPFVAARRSNFPLPPELEKLLAAGR